MLAQKLLSFDSGTEENLYVEDVFSTYVITDDASRKTINSGINFSEKGGLCWIKSRGSTSDHYLFDTARTSDYGLRTNSTSAQAQYGTNITWNTNGLSHEALFTVGTSVEWHFRKAPKFFDVVTYTGDGVAGRQIAHNLGCDVGMIVVKCLTNSLFNWTTYDRTSGASKYMRLNQTGASSTYTGMWNDTSPTTTIFTIGSADDVNKLGDQYVAYLFAHDPSADGFIQCGSYSGTGLAGEVVNFGFEPQYVMIKCTNYAGDWHIYDCMRGMTVLSDGTSKLLANLSNAETITGSPNSVYPTPTGFGCGGGIAGVNQTGGTYIYLAIRRPMKVPTSGSEVFAPILSSEAANTVKTTGFPIDMQLCKYVGTYSWYIADRLRGVPTTSADSPACPSLQTQTPSAESTTVSGLFNKFSNTGFAVPQSLGGASTIYHSFKRAKGFMDIVCYTGNDVSGRTINHNLGVVPEFMIVKKRSSGGEWTCYHIFLGNTKYIVLNNADGTYTFTMWANTFPTTDVFYVGSNSGVNGIGSTYVAYLFATLAGVQWINSYVGDGTTGRVINCGFTSGARFICIKATSTTGNWWIFDSSRGILAAADPVLALNSTAAEITSADAIDPHSSGFIVNQEATCSINASGVSYLVWAIA